MIDLYYWPTPNGHKIPIMLEECGLPYTVHPINMLKGDQFDPEYLKLNPNNKIPTIVDRNGPGGAPYTVFESGAILLYLAEKTGRFIPKDTARRFDVIQWLIFQVANVGPLFGQCGHFFRYAPEKIPYAIDRYWTETKRLYRVMDKRLAAHAYLAGEYSIADMATYPWVKIYDFHNIALDDYPHVKRWRATVGARPAVIKGCAVLEDVMKLGNPDKEAFDNLFTKQKTV
ncbi:MAG: glutathione S-transferase N-terminal domain-containing protein [Rhodospirillaceae bacterium]|nr:glutathione S-transferase N-terminal domain-containing protein [Rhodospirillaceae bacterium]